MPPSPTAWLLLLGVTVGCTRHVPGSTPPPGGASQRLEVASSGHLLVGVTIEGRPCTFVLDTGANITALSLEAARDLGVVATGSMPINGAVVAATGVVHSLAVSGVAHEDVEVAIIDLPDALAIGAQGVLGLDVLSRHDLVVDLVDQEFGVYPPGTIAGSGRDLVRFGYGANGLIIFPLILANDAKVPAMLDLGAPVSVLNPSAGLLIGARRPVEQLVARTGDAMLGPVRVLVRDLGTFRRMGLAHSPAIVLGADMFEDRVLAISYRDRVAFLSPEPSVRRALVAD